MLTFRRARLCTRSLVLLSVLAVFAVIPLGVESAQGSVISYGLSIEFSGGTPPAGSTPWITATFDDQNTPGTVQLKLETTNLVGTEFVRGWYFNFNPLLNLSDISFSAPVKTGTFSDPTINMSTNAYKADGDGKYDIRIDFATSGPNRFGVGDSVEYTITGLGSAAALVAADFDFMSQPDGGHGPFPTAAHVQGIGPGGSNSGWATVPEPASWMLTACALVGL